MDKNQPRSPADPRPGRKPAFISSRCPRCGEELVLADRIDEKGVAEKEIWHDEWLCPVCRDRVYLDVPADRG